MPNKRTQNTNEIEKSNKGKKLDEIPSNAGVFGFLDPLWHKCGPVTVMVCSVPCLLLTNWGNMTEAILTVFVILNSYIRIVYPSCYIPHTQVKPGFIYSPIAARILATVAEIGYFRY